MAFTTSASHSEDTQRAALPHTEADNVPTDLVEVDRLLTELETNLKEAKLSLQRSLNVCMSFRIVADRRQSRRSYLARSKSLGVIQRVPRRSSRKRCIILRISHRRTGTNVCRAYAHYRSTGWIERPITRREKHYDALQMRFC